ncbi:MAG: hypothetical protein AB1696_19550 [Planctomycetota bacterium]
MKTPRFLLIGLVIGICLSGQAEDGMLIGAPDMPPTMVDPSGGLRETWGTVRLSLIVDGAEAGKASQSRPEGDAPTVVTTASAGPLSLTVIAYRAPIWPSGVDVMEAVVKNADKQAKTATLFAIVPEKLQRGGMTFRTGSRTVLSLPPAPPVVKNTGCLTGAQALPKWGKPDAPCDASFHNIRAGMGGIPIEYRFAVEKGSARTVALGFCESHHAEAGKRPQIARVEGAADQAIDPIAKWGQHKPGCLVFDAKDANGDEWIEIAVLPKEGAPDRNPILNTIWIFPAKTAIDAAQVISGAMNKKAEHYVDVGGPSDLPQSVPGKVDFKPGQVSYPLQIEPGKEERLTFLLACAGASAPVWEETAWTPANLRSAADAVWSDWFKAGGALKPTDQQQAAQLRAALAEIMMCRAQADDYYLALPKPGDVKQFSYTASARIVRALDMAGYPREAERMLRLYWQKPAPQAFVSLAQTDEGQWSDAVSRGCPQAQALLALTEHALLTKDKDWAGRAYPAMRAGADWLRKARTGGKAPTGQDAAWAARALLSAAETARMIGKSEDAAWMAAEAKTLGDAAPDDAIYASLVGSCVDAANTVIRICTASR